MAIQDQPTGSTQSFAQAGTTGGSSAAPAAAPAAPGDQTPHSARPASLLRMGLIGGIVRSAAGEALTKGFTAVSETIKEMTISSSLKVAGVKIDNQQETGLKLSSIVLVLQHLASGTVAHHTLLLEASADPLQPTIVNSLNGVQVQIDRFASQVYDNVYASAVDKTVGVAFPNAVVRNAAATVVPRSFNWEDKDAVREMVANAALAAATYLEARLPGFIDMDMTKVKDPNEQLQVQISWDGGTTTDFVGLPVRSDVQIVASVATTQRNENQSLNTQNETLNLSRTTGYIDLTWAGSANPLQGFMNQQPGMNRKYRPRLVITRLENALRLTPAAQLFAIASSLCLTENYAWIRAFQPKRNVPQGQRDPRDIGAINIEANLPTPAMPAGDPSGFGKPIETKTQTFGDRELGQLIFATMHPELVISIDVSDAGADTWYNRVFSTAAGGNPEESLAANKEILMAANTLTGGKFGQLYGANTFLPIMKTDERVLMGYYINKEGQKCDIRDVDYLAVMNVLGRDNPQAIVDWSQTIEATEQPQPLRLQGRKTILRNVVDSITFTQLATRATFNPQFLTMLVQALAASNSIFKLITGQSGDYMSQRAGGVFNQAAFGMGSTGLFNAFSGGAQGANFSNRPYQGQAMF